MSAFFRKCLAAALFFSFFIAQAQTDLAEVLVASTKLPQKETELSKSVIVLSDSVIRANSGLSISQLLQKQAGISVVGAGQPLGSIQSLYNRGANSGYTLILVDGVPLYEPSSTENNFDLNLLNLSNIERIEILKGGQSVLYGSDAVAGVINFITKKASDKVISPNARISYGSFNTLEANAGISGKVIGLNYDFSLGKSISDGFSSAATSSANPEKDGFDKTNYAVKISKKIGALNLTAFGRQSEYLTDLDAGIFVDDKDYTFSSKNGQLGFLADFVKEKAQVHLKTNWSKIDRVFEDDSTDVPANAFAKYVYSTFASNAAFADLFADFRVHKNINVLVGTDYRAQKMAQTYLSVSDFGNYEDLPIEKNQTETTNSSVYSALKASTAYGLGIELAGRINWHSVYGSNYSWSVNPYYKLNEELTFFAVYGSSFKNPTLYQLYSPYGNADLIPEQALSLDLGFRGQIKESGTQFQATYFNRKVEDLITYINLSEAPFGLYKNQDKQRVSGFEASVNQKIGKVSLFANYTFLSGFTIDSMEKEEKTDLIRRPKNQFAFGGTWAVCEKLLVSADMSRVGKRKDQFYNNDTFATEFVDLKAYTLFNLNVRYKITEHFQAFGQAQNVFNTHYTEIYGYNSQKANVKLGLQFSGL